LWHYREKKCMHNFITTERKKNVDDVVKVVTEKEKHMIRIY